MQAIGHGASHIGNRERNEDYTLVDDALGLYIVCDGMGGHAGGHVASRLAAQTVASFIRANRSVVEAVRSGELSLRAARYLVEDAIQMANDIVCRTAEGDAWLRGMGTTLTMLLLTGDHAVMGHIGDSRLYRIRGTELERLSRDHTMAEELVKAGLLSSDRASISRLSHVLTRCIGDGSEPVRADVELIPLHEGDLFLLSSDGLNPCLEHNRCGSRKRLFAGPLELLADDIVNLAVQSGADDNTTAIVVSIEGDDTLDINAYNLRAAV